MRTFSLLVSVALLAAGRSQSDPEWSPAKVENGVTVTFRDDARLSAREVRAVAELSHPADRIIALVCDFTKSPDPDVREARVLSGEIGSRYTIYLRYASRYWGVSARDVVIDVRRAPTGCSWAEVTDRLPQQSGAVRMPLLRGSWTVESIDPSHSRVTYQITVRPGGSIPDWMVRRGAAGALPDVIARVSKCLSSPRTACQP